MEKSMKNVEMLKLLCSVQCIQLKDCGVHKFNITTNIDEDDGSLWFGFSFWCGEDFHYAACYSWRSYEENVDVLNKVLVNIGYAV